MFLLAISAIVDDKKSRYGHLLPKVTYRQTINRKVGVPLLKGWGNLMNLKQSALEFVNLVKVDRIGQEYRESLPRWLAEIAIGCIPAEEPEVAYAWIEPILVDPRAAYPARQATPQQIVQAAFNLADYLPFRLVG
jgi:hypothetical protein